MVGVGGDGGGIGGEGGGAEVEEQEGERRSKGAHHEAQNWPLQSAAARRHWRVPSAPDRWPSLFRSSCFWLLFANSFLWTPQVAGSSPVETRCVLVQALSVTDE